MIDIPKHIPLKVKVVDIAAGNWHSLILDTDGNCYGVGHNKYGSCGIGTFDNAREFTKCSIEVPIKTVAAGDGYSLMLSL